jgi:hypothetical protein
MEDLLEKGLSWKGGCFASPKYRNDEGSFHDDMIEFGSEIDEEGGHISLIMQENGVAFEDDLKD